MTYVVRQYEGHCMWEDSSSESERYRVRNTA